MVRVGVVGTGGMAAQRVQCLREIEGVAVSAICSRSRERARSLCPEARAFDDYGAMLDAVDAAVLCLPNHLHARYALQALDRGRHVLVEYPLCTTTEEMAALRRAGEASGRVLMVGNTIVHEAMFRYVSQHQGRLGELISAASRVGYFGSDIAGEWYMDPAQAGSPFVSYHYHHIEYYRRLLGDVQWVLACDESRPDPVRPGLLSLAGGTLIMRHAGGATSSIQWYLSASGEGRTPRGFWLNGLEGSLTIVSHKDDVSLAVLDLGAHRTAESFREEWGVAGSSEDFIAAIRGELDHSDRLEQDMRTLAIGFAAAESARRKKPVSLE